VVRIEKGNFRLKGVAKGKDLIYKPEVDLTKVKA
jgi:hypothetical protein